MFEELQQILQSLGTYTETIFGTFEDYAWLGVALIAAFAYLLARLIAGYLPNMLEAMAKRLKIKIPPEVVELLRFPLFNLIFLAGLLIAVSIATISPALTFAIKAILKSVMIAVVGLTIFRLIKIILEHTAHNSGHGLIQLKTLPLFTNVALVFVLIGTSHQIFAVWDVDMTALLASAGIAGIAVGMAAKDMLADVIAGVLILTDNPYNVGDVIQLGSGEDAVKGKVTRIGMRSTRILTEYNIEVIMPNSKMASSRILNESSSPKKIGIVTMEIKTAADVNPKQIRQLFIEGILSHPEVLRDEEVEVLILDFDDRTVTWELVFCTPQSDWDEVISCQVREIVFSQLQQAGVKFALPSEHDLAMLQMADSKQEVAITHLPDSRQEVHIKEMPNEARTLHVKEIPSLFGNGPVKIENPTEHTERQRRTVPYRSITPTPTTPKTTEIPERRRSPHFQTNTTPQNSSPASVALKANRPDDKEVGES